MAGDPDHRIFWKSRDSFCTGVPVGVGPKAMPRTPALYERKTKWRKYDETEFSWKVDNYSSARSLGPVLEAQFQEEALEGMMFSMPLSEARSKYKDLRIAGQGAVPKSDGSVRIVRDGTHGV